MDDNQKQPIVITDINIPFTRLVMIIIKIVLASIPAYFIIALILFVTSILFVGIFGGYSSHIETMPFIQ